jgi:hypothetical protein
MFSNFTRKLTLFALVIWALAVVVQVFKGTAINLIELATSAGIIIGVAAAKSIGTDAVKNGKPCPPTQ